MNAEKNIPLDNFVRLFPENSDNITLQAGVEFGGGNGGGGMLEKLEKRVKRLEGDVSAIKTNLATLTTRSENFATLSNQDKMFVRAEGFASKNRAGKTH